MKLPRPIRRAMASFLEGPASVRGAIRVIVTATVVTTLLGAVLVWIFDRDSFGSFGSAVWWSLQTVTTVGYGDVTPSNGIGRLIGAAVLLYAVAFLAILTATITTAFVEQASRERREEDDPDLHRVLARLDEIDARLDRWEEERASRRGDGDAGPEVPAAE